MSAYILIGIIVCFYSVNNLIWLSQNTYPSGPDEPKHLTTGLLFSSFIPYDINGIFQSLVSPMSDHWPPFYYISSAILNFFWGDSYISLVMVNIPYLIILLFSVYFIGLKLFDTTTGMLATLFVSIYPLVFVYSRFFGPDFAVTAMVCLSVCLLIYTKYFENRKISILFGLSLGLGMLTKWTFILFLIGPLTYTLLKIFFLKLKQWTDLRQILFNFSLSLVIGILISSTWYLSAAPILVRRTNLAFLETYGSYDTPDYNLPLPQISSRLTKFFDYSYLLVNEGISLLFFIFLLIALFFYFKRNKNKLLLIILWFVIPYLILSLQYDRQTRHMLPSLPAVALISAVGLQSIDSKKWRYLLFYTVIVLGLVQFFSVSYDIYNILDEPIEQLKYPIKFETSFGPMFITYVPLTGPHSWSYGSPLKKNWRMDKIANALTRHYNDSLISREYDFLRRALWNDSLTRVFSLNCCWENNAADCCKDYIYFILNNSLLADEFEKPDKYADCCVEYLDYTANKSISVGLIHKDEENYDIFGQPYVMQYYLIMEASGLEIREVADLFIYAHSNSILKFIARLDELDYVIFISKNNSWPEYDAIKEDFNRVLNNAKIWAQGRQGIFLSEPPADIDDYFIEEANKKIRHFLNDKDNEFKLVDEIKLPDNYTAYIHSKIKVDTIDLDAHKMGVSG